jgi:hypothetical protein
MEKFIQFIDDETAKQTCLDTFKNGKWETTMDTVGGVPQLVIGRVGIFEIRVRYAKTSFRSPNWDAGAWCGGCTQKGGFATYEEAKEWAIKTAQKEDEELNQRINNR